MYVKKFLQKSTPWDIQYIHIPELCEGKACSFDLFILLKYFNNNIYITIYSILHYGTDENASVKKSQWWKVKTTMVNVRSEL